MKAEGKIFGIDIDEVLRNTLPVMVDLYNKEFGTNMLIDDVTEWDVGCSFPLIREKLHYSDPSKWFFHDHAKEIFLDARPFKYAASTLNKIKNNGNKITIITYQSGTLNKIYALEWLSHNKIPYDNICFIKDKTNIKCDVFIDDNDWNIVGCNAETIYLVNKPYNKNVDLNCLLKKCGANTKMIKRINAIEEIF